MKKIGLNLASISLAALVLAGCGFSVGTPSNNDDYKDLFPDRAAKLDSAYKTSNMGYKFSLGGDYGEMMVYVDTSDGYSFELMENSPAGFTINDKDGNVALYAVCMDKDQYAEYSAYADTVKTVNGRDFLYTINSDGSEDCYSYMADCGLDCGLVLEVHDNATDNFELVAFRGTPIEGASSDVHFYQGAAPVVEDDIIEEDADSTVSDSDETDLAEAAGNQSLTNTTLSSDVEDALNALNTDYNKVMWGSRYSLFEDTPALVVSVTPCLYYDGYALAVAVTNLYDTDLSFSGQADALGADGSIIGSTFFYTPCLGRGGNTIVNIITCDGDQIPDGRIHWSDCELGESYSEYVPWEADYTASGKPSDGVIDINYSLYTSSGEACTPDMMTVMLVNEEGFALTVGTDYADAIPENGKVDGDVSIYADPGVLSNARDVAIFTNTVK